ncbi:MAG: hypothetical protein ACTS1Z_14555 [Parasphingopyxis sp.]|uniref:hypothetical protein n=1 Tax=Parasphingopyxis sp. TaxID=1920299 RepID=UPI003F9F974A
MERSRRISPYDLSRPAMRELRIYSTDPSMAQSLATAEIHETIVTIPWEAYPDNRDRDGPAPGPIGEYLEIVDYDGGTGCFYKPVDLNEPYILAQNGLDPSEGNPQFHQQMVYAVAMRTIGLFESALGRKVFWAHRKAYEAAADDDSEGYVQRLRIYPHALREANAYYSPSKVALLFGYFRPDDIRDDRITPGGVVFTCLSHDIIAHETAHALLDGMHRRLLDASNSDMLAFHEAFADIVALFQHFSIPHVLEYQIAQSNGFLDRSGSMLGDIARQFGEAIGRGKALRSAAGHQADPHKIQNTFEPHARGSILVAAVFDAFCSIYEARSADLKRLGEARSDGQSAGHLHPDLVRRLANEAAKSAEHVLKMCIRALDYLPPVDITFGNFLRALVTADTEVMPHDPLRYRTAFMESFRKWGIFPKHIQSFSEDGLRWDNADLTASEWPQVFLGDNLNDQLAKWDLRNDRQETFTLLRRARAQVHKVIDNSRRYKSKLISGVDLSRTFEVHSVKPSRRIGSDGQITLDAVIEITQRRPGWLDRPFEKASQCWTKGSPKKGDFWFRNGCTLIVDLGSGLLRYCIFKDGESEDRYERQRSFLRGEDANPSLRGVYGSDGEREDEILAMVHLSERES